MKQQRDSWQDLRTMSIDELVERLQKYPFTDPIGHRLEMNAEFIELVRRAKQLQRDADSIGMF